jgi:hypothetical protein
MFVTDDRNHWPLTRPLWRPLYLPRVTEHRKTWTYIQFLTEITIRDYTIREVRGPRESRHCNRLFRYTYVFGTFFLFVFNFILVLKIISPAQTNGRRCYGWITMVGSVKETWTTSTCNSKLQWSVTFQQMNTIKFPCGGGLEYLHRSPARRRRRRKWNPVPWDITGLHCYWKT